MSISPGLINKVHSIYISVPWFRFTLMDLSFRVLFHRFQIIFDRIRLTFYVAIGTKSTNAIKYNPGITAVSGDRVHEHKKNKLLVSPNERLNNIILERTIQMIIPLTLKIPGGERIHAISEIESTLKERPKSTFSAHVLTCSTHVSLTVPVYWP